MRLVCAILAMAVLIGGTAAKAKKTPPRNARARIERMRADGNWKDAYEAGRELTLDPDADPMQVGYDLAMAVSCLQQLNRRNETDKFREEAIAVHKANWRLLQAAAESYYSENHNGFMIAGEFQRGHHRGGGKPMNCVERDRVRALQLMARALPLVAEDKKASDRAGFFLRFGAMVLGYRGYAEAWRLQYLTDLTTLPDYEDGYGHRHYHHRGGSPRGAPVDPDGNPVLHHVPESFDAARTDGERWRRLLEQARTVNPKNRNNVLKMLADFHHQQFGVQTMGYYGGWFARPPADDDTRGATYALHTLDEDETIAKLATGVKRFELPDEFNFIHGYLDIVEDPNTGYGEQALNQLATISENRRQLDKAAGFWRQSIKKHGPGNNKWKQKRVDQIVDNWGQFDSVSTHAAGERATLEYRFRNGESVTFSAYQIRVKELLEDVKKYLKSNPRKLDRNRVNLGRIGYRLVAQNEKKYRGDRVARWTRKLDPPAGHFDKRITIDTPLKDAGAYLLTADMDDGNTCSIVIWINDTVIVRKQMPNGRGYFVADAVTGKPIAKATVEFFGYRQERTNWQKAVGRRYDVKTSTFAEHTNEDGFLFVPGKDAANNYQWLATATTPAGRLAFLGFSHLWYGQRHDPAYNATKVFMISDRPVYRPDQSVKLKFWLRHARYDREDTSDFAKRNFLVEVVNSKREKVHQKMYTTDAYGGIVGEFTLAGDAMLGMYHAYVKDGSRRLGGGHFRVEEYKKPEFEVKIEAPDEPVMLGEKITATIESKYYFGAPVTHAKVKYKVLRSAHGSRWYPAGRWDWFYGPGYWWFGYDYEWYPGWYEWGCCAPLCWWIPARHDPPEVVAEAEVEVGPDGKVEVAIDTALAKAMHGDQDHRYEFTAEVTDQSRRTIVGRGTVLVAREPFKVYAWVDRGHYRAGDVIRASFSARRLDSKPVQGKGLLRLLRLSYKDGEPIETVAREWKLDTNDEGRSELQMKASEPGQYRLSYRVTDSAGHEIEGGYVFVVRGEGFDGKEFRFDEIEVVPEKREYAPGETVDLVINTAQADSTVLLFVRPTNGMYLEPKIIRVKGKCTVEELAVTKKDMPNFFVEAVTVSGGKVYTATREIVVPPEKRVVNVEVLPSAEKYKPGEHASVRVKLTDLRGKPFVGSLAMCVYDRAVEYISGGSNIPGIREFFWKWRRRHNPAGESNAGRYFACLHTVPDEMMKNIGVFGHMIADQLANGLSPQSGVKAKGFFGKARALLRGGVGGMMANGRAEAVLKCAPAPMAAREAGAAVALEESCDAEMALPGQGGGGAAAAVEPTVRTKFADTAFWAGALETDASGMAEVSFDMPENLTGWKVRTWAMGHGTKVGEGTTEVVTTKNLLLRLQAPRFFVEKDEVVLSANIHNYLENPKSVRAVLEVDGGCLELVGDPAQVVQVGADDEKRVDWRVKVMREGEAVVRMKALTDEESDAMEMRFPVYVHGMLKMESFCGVIRPDGNEAAVAFSVPAERRIEQSRLEVRYSPTLAGACIDALPYLVGYPYGCTEQTLNRFLPTVMTQKILMDMGLDLTSIRDKRTNLNAQEIGDDKERAAQWRRYPHNPVFDEEEVREMVKAGIRRLASMQLSDGGWGWFSGYHERSYPHTTAYVVHGLQVARENDVALIPGMLERGVKWLERYEKDQTRKIRNAPKRKKPWKSSADNLDAFVYMVLNDADHRNAEMRDYLYRDRNNLAVYAKAMLALALHKQGDKEKAAMLQRNIEQFLVEDDENQSAWLNLPNGRYWWYWYGSEYEAHAYYLKLLAAVDPKSDKAAGLVKYLLNNRKHATYWNSTRDTAICVEALADFMRASEEDKPDMTVEVLLDGQVRKTVKIDSDNLFSFDNKLVLTGKSVTSGDHKVELRRKGKGPVYFNAYLTNFTLEDFITKAGLEIKVERKVYRLKRVDKSIKAAGSRGQVLDRKVEKYERELLDNDAVLKSGDLLEIELEIASKNDYEYIVFEDMKAAGCEPVDVRSGYKHNDGMGAYVEFRDERVAFFVRWLARGKHSMAYRVRAEIPGRFSALPTKAHAMYAPELKANSDEFKLRIED